MAIRELPYRFLALWDCSLADLKAPYPYLSICNREAHDVVHEWLGFSCALGHAKDVCEKFFDDK